MGIFAQISLDFARRNTDGFTEFIEKFFLRGFVKADAVIMDELLEINIVISHILDDFIKILDDGIKNLDLEHIDLSCEEVSRRATFGDFEVTYGVLEDDCDALFEPLAPRSGNP